MNRKYELLTVNEIADRIIQSPDDSVHFALRYQCDENGAIIEASIEIWCVVTLISLLNDNRKIAGLGTEGGEKLGVYVGDDKTGDPPTPEQIRDAIEYLFAEYQFKKDKYCVRV